MRGGGEEWGAEGGGGERRGGKGDEGGRKVEKEKGS